MHPVVLALSTLSSRSTSFCQVLLVWGSKTNLPGNFYFKVLAVLEIILLHCKTWLVSFHVSILGRHNYKWVCWKISTPTMGSMNINTFQPSEIPKCSSTCSPYPLQIPILLKIINPLFIFWFLFKPLGIPFRLPNLHFFPNPGIFCVLFSVKQTRNSSL